MENILASLNTFRMKVVHIMANVSWKAEPQAEMILLIILGYVVVILLLMMLHRTLLRRHKRIHENIVLLYDTIRYQLAKAQYGNPNIQDSKGINVVIESKHKNYVVNIDEIHEEILSIEQKLGQKIISEDQRKIIIKKTHKKKITMTFVQLIGRVITLLTAGIYKLFW